MEQKIEEAKQYFQHESMFYLFVLRFMDGTALQDYLGIKRTHYLKSKKAKEWYDDILAKLTPADQFVGTGIVYEAEQNLKQIYHRMIGKA